MNKIACLSIGSVFFGFLAFAGSYHYVCTFTAGVTYFTYPPESVICALISLQLGFTAVKSFLRTPLKPIEPALDIHNMAPMEPPIYG
ncbi:hypothetical protein DU002_14225 [Corallincola holothuriorum]|uniref:Uncharacterized protein n=1 Tax=Corallincola holothuriorum TaxID=2282215 RepID=A0A368N531_9GAMM|nr:hypothetical protein [Corallincola holothuriorum]RCU45618.1 hypothetical protein DU002_14225 [Corallincola holothuriorum]